MITQMATPAPAVAWTIQLCCLVFTTSLISTMDWPQRQKQTVEETVNLSASHLTLLTSYAVTLDTYIHSKNWVAGQDEAKVEVDDLQGLVDGGERSVSFHHKKHPVPLGGEREGRHIVTVHSPVIHAPVIRQGCDSSQVKKAKKKERDRVASYVGIENNVM